MWRGWRRARTGKRSARRKQRAKRSPWTPRVDIPSGEAQQCGEPVIHAADMSARKMAEVRSEQGAAWRDGERGNAEV